MRECLTHHIENCEFFRNLCDDAGFKVEDLKTEKDLEKIPPIHANFFKQYEVLSVPFETYLRDCFTFGKAAEGTKLIVYRLWNNGGADELNQTILDTMTHHFPSPWTDNRQGKRIGDRVFLEYGDKFDWPDLTAEEGGCRVFCYGLRDQLGVLCDGTVVPCCLDHDGDIPLGNLFHENMDDILATPRAMAIYEGFTKKEAAEELCRKCGYARRFK